MNRVVLGAITMLILMSGCEEKYKYTGCHEPKTLSLEELRSEYPKFLEGKEIGKAAKIYNYKNGDILLINERNKGIHVVDNRVEKRGKVSKGDKFIQIPGNVDMAVKDGYLYADSFTDLLVLDIRDINDIKLVTRKEKIFAVDYRQASYDDTTKDKCYYHGSEFIIGYE